MTTGHQMTIHSFKLTHHPTSVPVYISFKAV